MRGTGRSSSAAADCEGGRESGMWVALVADELGKSGTGGRLRTGVEGVCAVASEESLGSDLVCVGDDDLLIFV
jgi:hypothetical protein